MIASEHFVERVTYRPKSRDLPEKKCVGCGSMFYSGFKHRWGRQWNLSGFKFRDVEGENTYCEECAPGLLSESFVEYTEHGGKSP